MSSQAVFLSVYYETKTGENLLLFICSVLFRLKSKENILGMFLLNTFQFKNVNWKL